MNDPAAPTTPAAVPPVPPAPDWDARLPSWQQSVNRFCENWIFAFVVAMAIRHCALEAFRIPSASMEPMLYGDPAFMKGDYVVVDKLWCRFTGVRRWDVTVFQFPQPEVEAPGNDARPAINAMGERLDVPMIRPLMYRNFVKRAVVLPGDTFFIRCGDVVLKQPDGSWRPARKPDNVQEAVWMDVWRHGTQEGYVPWTGSAGATVASQGDGLMFTLAQGGAATFTQPLCNLYLKPGRFRVRPVSGDGDELIDLDMLKPVFTWKRTGEQGNAWDLDHWYISRMTSADLDSNTHGTALNPIMQELVGDARLLGTVQKLDGEVAIELRQGTVHAYRLVLSAAGWRVEGDGKALAQGTDAVQGQTLSFAHIDGQIVAAIAGREVLRHDVPLLDAPQRLTLHIAGQGTLALAGAHLQRDLHYTQRGFLTDQTVLHAHLGNQVTALLQQVTASRIDCDKSALSMRLIPDVRAQMRGKTVDDLSSREATTPVGTGPDNAITAPPGAHLLLGDNSPHSWDAREWGWVPVENVRGRALAVVMPWTRWRVVR